MMTPFIRQSEAERLRNAPENSFQKRLYNEMYARCKKNTREDQWVQEEDTQLWYHLCWERMSDAAFIWAMEKDEAIGQWIRNRVMELLALSKAEWVGPDFRENFRSQTARQPVGALEAGHASLALSEAYANAGDLFSEEEKAAIREKLKTAAIPLCRAFLEVTLTTERPAHYGNWTTVLANGLGVSSMMVGDEENIRFALDFAALFTEQYSQNDYGETLQYSNYAALQQANLFEIAMRMGYGEGIEYQHLARLMPWYAQSLLYVKPIGSVGWAPRSVNFGDSAAIFRPTGNLLTFVSKYAEDETARGLASWLLHTTYDARIQLPDELATFGFVNQFSYLTILNLPDCAAPLSPKEAHLPLESRYERGILISRDSWENTRTTVAIMAGYDPKAPVYTKAGHSHIDQNSFTITVGKERILADPGHCNYRSRTYAFSLSDRSHSLPQIYTQKGRLNMLSDSGSAATMRLLGNQLLCNKKWDDVQIVASDMGNQFARDREIGNQRRNVLRIWLMRLPGMMLMLDYACMGEPIRLGATFVINQRDNKTKIQRSQDDQELLITRGGEGMKLFCGGCLNTDQEAPVKLSSTLGYMHDFYHPLENRVNQGREGSAAIYEWQSAEFGKKALITYAMAMDQAEGLNDWACEKEGNFTTIRNLKTGQFMSASFDLGKVTLKTEKGEYVFNPYFSDRFAKVAERKYYTDPIF